MNNYAKTKAPFISKKKLEDVHTALWDGGKVCFEVNQLCIQVQTSSKPEMDFHLY